MIPMKWPGNPGDIRSIRIFYTAKGPAGPLRRFRRPVMTKTSPKTNAGAAAASAVPLIVIGYDEDQKPRGAQFTASNPNLVKKAAELMESRGSMRRAPKNWLPLPRNCPRVGSTRMARASCRTSSRASTAKLSWRSRSSLKRQSAKTDDLPVATGLPKNWDEIAPGHLVIAQETLEYGWWEAIVLERNGDMLKLRFRDSPAAQNLAPSCSSRLD